jgi:hypothetical protein
MQNGIKTNDYHRIMGICMNISTSFKALAVVSILYCPKLAKALDTPAEL